MCLLFKMNFLFVVYLLGLLWLCVSARPHVKVAQGMLKGREFVTDDGKCYHSYLGIPYAAPPVGNLRYQAPQEPEPWIGVRDATKEGNVCISYDMTSVNRDIVGDEDCLFLNVHTPRRQETSDPPLPVMFYVHGGGFLSGSGNSDIYGADWFMEQDVILVTTNYRLGPFGFLSLDIEEAPGNAGLKDQVAALRWVNENIAAFGGDPGNITIFGESAGGASVSYLVLSDITEGLFQKAMIWSGSALNIWAHVDNAKENAYKLCSALGHQAQSDVEALEFLRTVSADEILKAVGKPPWSTVVVDENHSTRDMTFVPIVEKPFPGAILSVSFVEKLKSGKFQHVPIMAGFTDGEGILAVKDAVEDPISYGLKYIDFTWFIPNELCLNETSEKYLEVADKIKEFYIGDTGNNTTDDNLDILVQIRGDTWFKRGINNMVKLLAEHSTQPVYYYRYSFGEFGILKDFYGKPGMKGACHGDEPGYVFKNKYVELPIVNSTKVARTHKRLLELYTNFAETGNPTPEATALLPVKLAPVTKDSLNYLSIDSELSVKTNPDHDAMQFWEDLIQNYTACDNKIVKENIV